MAGTTVISTRGDVRPYLQSDHRKVITLVGDGLLLYEDDVLVVLGVRQNEDQILEFTRKVL